MNMTDIIERLRARCKALDAYHDVDEMHIMTEAANEIERLRVECKRWQEVASQGITIERELRKAMLEKSK